MLSPGHFFLGDMLTSELLEYFGFTRMKGVWTLVGGGRPEGCQVLEWMGMFIVWETAAEDRWAGKMLTYSPSLGCIPQDIFHITVVALCHPAVILKLPGGQNKGGLAPHGPVGSGGANILTFLSEQAGDARCPGLDARRCLGSGLYPQAGTALSSQIAPSV